MNKINEIIKEICEEEKIKYSTVSKDWVTVLEKDGKRRFVIGYKFDINPYAAGAVCNDKYATADFLTFQQIPAVEERIFYAPNNHEDFAEGCNSLEAVTQYFHANNNNVVVKQNNGTGGVDIYHVTDEKSLADIYDQLLKKYYSISIGPFYDIENEYRVIMLDHEPKVIYKKIKPEVVGDGYSTISQLLTEFNPKYFSGRSIENDRVLEFGETFEYNWKFNLCGGAKASLDIDEQIRAKVIDLAKQATKALNMRFCSVDIIKTKDNKLLIMEVNTGVMMENFIVEMENGKEIAKSIYKEAIEKMFE